MIPIKPTFYKTLDGLKQKYYPQTHSKAVLMGGGTTLDNVLKTHEENLSDAFDETKAYQIGDYCIYLNRLYKFTSEKEAGAFDGTKVVPCNIASEFNEKIASVMEEIPKFKIIEFNLEEDYTMSQGSRKTFNLELPTINGYRPFFIKRIDFAYGHDYNLIVKVCGIDNVDRLNIQIYNTENRTITTNMKAIICYISTYSIWGGE